MALAKYIAVTMAESRVRVSAIFLDLKRNDLKLLIQVEDVLTHDPSLLDK